MVPPKAATAKGRDPEAFEPQERNSQLLGRSRIFTPEVIDDIHIKSELGRYRMRGFSLFKKIPHWDDLTFLPGTLTRFVIEGYREKCITKTVLGPRAKRPLVLDIPVYITGMSFGALSYEAKIALARGATMAGSATCSGEGGMIPDERRYSSKWYYQCIQSRYGFNPHHLRLADAVEFFIGQGCKVGLGGHLMGQKVTDQVAEMRSLPAGIDQRSPARHPDWLGPDDLALKIEEIREATNWEIPIQLKLGAARVYDDVRMAAKTGPDMIYIDGMEGSTGAGPHLATEDTGVPGIAAIRQARKALNDVGKSGEISLIYAGGIRNGSDIAKALALGADAVAIGHSSLMALNCNKAIPEADYEAEVGVPAGYCYHCHTGRCPVGVATQDPILRKRLDPDKAAERVYNFLHTLDDGMPDDGARLRQNEHPLARAGGSRSPHHGSLRHGDGAARGNAAYRRPSRDDPLLRRSRPMAKINPNKPVAVPTQPSDIDHFIKGDGVDTEREKLIGQHIGYRYDVNLVPDYSRLTPFLKDYIETMGWSDLNWLEDVHMGYEEGRPAVFDRNVNGWVQVPADRQAAQQSAGSRHACARALDQVPDERRTTHSSRCATHTRSSDGAMRT